MPHLADSEVANALRSQVLRGKVSDGDARVAVDRWSSLGVRRFPVVALLGRMWELGANLTAYGATYVALAEAIDCELLTADRRLAGAPGPQCSIIVVRH